MAELISKDDILAIEPTLEEASLVAMIKLATARAYAAAPCLRDATEDSVLATVNAILVPAVLRWATSPAGGDVTEAAGPFSHSVKVPSGLLWPSEIRELRDLCATSSTGTVSAGRPRGRFPAARSYPDGAEL